MQKRYQPQLQHQYYYGIRGLKGAMGCTPYDFFQEHTNILTKRFLTNPVHVNRHYGIHSTSLEQPPRYIGGYLV